MAADKKLEIFESSKDFPIANVKHFLLIFTLIKKNHDVFLQLNNGTVSNYSGVFEKAESKTCLWLQKNSGDL